MKILIASALALAVLGSTAVMAAPHGHRHKVCSMHHHHRVCHWVR
ncbi:MAG TPA: HHHH-motif protein [Rhizomicrobium sp.]